MFTPLIHTTSSHYPRHQGFYGVIRVYVVTKFRSYPGLRLTVDKYRTPTGHPRPPDRTVETDSADAGGRVSSTLSPSPQSDTSTPSTQHRGEAPPDPSLRSPRPPRSIRPELKCTLTMVTMELVLCRCTHQLMPIAAPHQEAVRMNYTPWLLRPYH
jgi:hypothetical protein